MSSRSVTRVSSAATKSARPKVAATRGGMSSRLPIGVATRYKVPGNVKTPNICSINTIIPGSGSTCKKIMGKKATKELVLNKITRKTAKSVCDFILAGWHIICYNNFEHNGYRSVLDFITKAGETVDVRAQVKEILDENGGIAKSADFVSAGIRATELVNLCNLGYLTRVRHGYYEMAKESSVSEERMLAVLVPQGIVCVESALFHFGYSDFAPRKWSIAIPRSMSRTKLKIDTLAIQPYYVQENLYGLGKTVGNFNGVALPVYDRERTICDCFKYRSRLDNELFAKALNAYVNDTSKDLKNLSEYAKQLRVHKKVTELMEVLLNG